MFYSCCFGILQHNCQNLSFVLPAKCFPINLKHFFKISLKFSNFLRSQLVLSPSCYNLVPFQLWRREIELTCEKVYKYFFHDWFFFLVLTSLKMDRSFKNDQFSVEKTKSRSWILPCSNWNDLYFQIRSLQQSTK